MILDITWIDIVIGIVGYAFLVLAVLCWVGARHERFRRMRFSKVLRQLIILENELKSLRRISTWPESGQIRVSWLAVIARDHLTKDQIYSLIKKLIAFTKLQE